MLICDNITYKNGGETLFYKVGFCLLEGALLILRGTHRQILLRMLAEQPSIKGFKGNSGMHYISTASLDNKVVASRTSRLRRFFCPHKANQDISAMDVQSYIAFLAAQEGVELLADSVLHYWQLHPVRNHNLASLTPEMQARVKLSPLLLGSRKIWFLEEPFLHLDEQGEELLLKLIAVRCDQGGIVVLSAADNVTLPFGQELCLTDFTSSG